MKFIKFLLFFSSKNTLVLANIHDKKFINGHGKDFKITINCIVDFHLLDKLHNYFYIISKLKQY